MKSAETTKLPCLNIQQPGSSSATTHALIVGISKYQNIPSLTFADADAYNFYQYLISPAGGNIDSNNIRLLLNENATSANIFAALDWLLEVSKEGENVLIYFSADQRKNVVFPSPERPCMVMTLPASKR